MMNDVNLAKIVENKIILAFEIKEFEKLVEAYTTNLWKN